MIEYVGIAELFKEVGSLGVIAWLLWERFQRSKVRDKQDERLGSALDRLTNSITKQTVILERIR